MSSCRLCRYLYLIFELKSISNFRGLTHHDIHVGDSSAVSSLQLVEVDEYVWIFLDMEDTELWDLKIDLREVCSSNIQSVFWDLQIFASEHC